MYYRTNEGSLKWAKLTFIFIGREAYIMMELHWAFRPVSQLLRERLKLRDFIHIFIRGIPSSNS
jgi:hypothetical protein